MSRNFGNYYLGDNVYELAGGLIPDMGNWLDIDMGSEPNTESLGQLVGKLGANKVLRNNEEVQAMTREHMADLLEQSGVQNAASRSLWSPEITPENRGARIAVITGGVFNWMNRSAAIVNSMRFIDTVYAVAGTRVMDSPTESSQPEVQKLAEVIGKAPTEYEYMKYSLVPKIAIPKRRIIVEGHRTDNGDLLAQRFFENNPNLLGEQLVFARVANAGVQLAVQMRKAAHKLNPDFDNPANDNPQVYFHTDEFPIARTAEQDANPKQFQKSQTGLRQVALTAKLLHELSVS